MFENLQGSSLDRRSFLRGSAMFAAAIGVSVRDESQMLSGCAWRSQSEESFAIPA